MFAKKINKIAPLLLIAIIMVLWLLVGYLPVILFDSGTDRGTFGDMFGAVNSLFSGLAFAGLIYAILLQRKELELQRKELELTREELKKSATAQTQSSETLGKQLELAALSSRLRALSSLIQSINDQITSERVHIAGLSGVAAALSLDKVTELEGVRAGYEVTLKAVMCQLESIGGKAEVGVWAPVGRPVEK